MKSKAVWFLGVAGLAVLATAGLHYMLPQVENDVRARVDRVMTGRDDLRATVSGQTVTLTAMDADPEAAQKLAAAKSAIAAIKTPGEPAVPGSPWLAGTVTGIKVIAPTPPTPPTAAATLARTAADDVPPAVIGGEKATSIDTSVSTTPPVAGDDPPLSHVAAQACEEKLYKAMDGRTLAFVPGSYDLTPASQPVLDDLYKTMTACPADLQLTVVGYGDSGGDATAARLIAGARAQATVDGLIERGLAIHRVTAQSKGGAPVAGRAIAFEVSERE